MAAPPQKITSATMMTVVATAPRAATLSGRNGTPSRRTQRTSDALISTTPATAHRLAGGGARSGGGRSDVRDGDVESVTWLWARSRICRPAAAVGRNRYGSVDSAPFRPTENRPFACPRNFPCSSHSRDASCMNLYWVVSQTAKWVAHAIVTSTLRSVPVRSS